MEMLSRRPVRSSMPLRIVRSCSRYSAVRLTKPLSPKASPMFPPPPWVKPSPSPVCPTSAAADPPWSADLRMTLITPAMASEPYCAEAPSRSTSTRSMALIGMVSRSTPVEPFSSPPLILRLAVSWRRLPFTSTSTWLGLSPRSDCVWVNAEALNGWAWRVSEGSSLTSASRRSTAPLLRSWVALTTSIGLRLSCAFTSLLRVPVTTTVDKVGAAAAPRVSCTGACPPRRTKAPLSSCAYTSPLPARARRKASSTLSRPRISGPRNPATRRWSKAIGTCPWRTMFNNTSASSPGAMSNTRGAVAASRGPPSAACTSPCSAQASPTAQSTGVNEREERRTSGMVESSWMEFAHECNPTPAFSASGNMNFA